MNKELDIAFPGGKKKRSREAGKYTKIAQDSNGIKIHMADS